MDVILRINGLSRSAAQRIRLYCVCNNKYYQTRKAERGIISTDTKNILCLHRSNVKIYISILLKIAEFYLLFPFDNYINTTCSEIIENTLYDIILMQII